MRKRNQIHVEQKLGKLLGKKKTRKRLNNFFSYQFEFKFTANEFRIFQGICAYKKYLTADRKLCRIMKFVF